MSEHYETIIVGGSQAGLSVGYHLRQRGLPFVILDANPRVGDAWRTRWDSLRLFTPAKFSGLDGLPFPAPRNHKPTKDEMADYLETYAETLGLGVRTGVRVSRISKSGGRFVVETAGGTLSADSVVIATGAERSRSVPPYAAELDPGIVQLHSRDYRNASQLQPGPVLVVGVGNSGAEIALEVARTHQTWLAGKERGHVPFDIDSFKARFLVHVVRFVGHHVLSRATPIGRKAAPKLVSGGVPLVRTKPKQLVAAGIRRVPRVAGVRDGLPMLEDGRVLDVRNVVWCTGFRLDFSWIDLPRFDTDGMPQHSRGIVTEEPGLFFVGLPFQYSLTSSLLPGVGRDAAYVAARVAARTPAAPSAAATVR